MRMIIANSATRLVGYPSFSIQRTVVESLGSFRKDDGNGNENVISKHKFLLL